MLPKAEDTRFGERKIQSSIIFIILFYKKDSRTNVTQIFEQNYNDIFVLKPNQTLQKFMSEKISADYFQSLDLVCHRTFFSEIALLKNGRPPTFRLILCFLRKRIQSSHFVSFALYFLKNVVFQKDGVFQKKISESKIQSLSVTFLLRKAVSENAINQQLI